MILLRLPRPPFLAHPSSSHGSPTLHRLRLKPISCASFSSHSSGGASERSPPISSTTPARDRVIDFGKHRGKMLGTLPSRYLKWVSKKLRYHDYADWAKLADEVLGDPVYRDRVEWNKALRFLSGDAYLRSSAAYRSDSAVDDLLKLSKRYRWDFEDEDGWSQVDFELLGTSKGGRIPRLPEEGGGGGGGRGALVGRKGSSKVGSVGMDSGVLGTRKVIGSSGSAVGLERNRELGSPREGLGVQSHGDREPSFGSTNPMDSSTGIRGSFWEPVLGKKDFWVHETRKLGNLKGSEVGYLSTGFRFTVGEEGEEEESSMEEMLKSKRGERREKQKQKREQQLRTLRKEVGVDGGGGKRAVARGHTGVEDTRHSNTFPGRGELIDKIRGRTGL